MNRYLKEIINNLEIKENYIDNEGCYIEYIETEELNKIFNNVVSKQEIKDKMKKYEWSMKSYDSSIADYKQSQAVGRWSVLQELLQEN